MSNRPLKRCGVDTQVLATLASAGIVTAADVLIPQPVDLIHAARTMTWPQLQALVQQVSARVAPAPYLVFDAWLERGRSSTALSSGIPTLDAALGGGIARASVTEIVGAPGSGKTQLCLSLAAQAACHSDAGQAALPDTAESPVAGVLYIDTEGSFSALRLQAIVAARFPAADPDRVAGHVHVLKVSHAAELVRQLPRIEEVIIESRVRCLIVDSVAALIRRDFSQADFAERASMLATMATRLKQLAETFDLPVILTNHVTSRSQGRDLGAYTEAAGSTSEENQPALGIAWAHYINTRLALTRLAPSALTSPDSGGGLRVLLRIVKSATMPITSVECSLGDDGFVAGTDAA